MDGGYPPPPAQIRTCRITAYGSCLGYVTRRTAPPDVGACCGQAPWKRRKEVAADLRRIYTATTAEEAQLMLGEFEDRWDAQDCPLGSPSAGTGSGSFRSLTTRLKSVRSSTPPTPSSRSIWA